MEENTQLPKEVVEEIKQKAEDFANSHINGRTQPDVWEIVFRAKEAGAIAYATKLHQVEEVIKVLTYDNNRLKGEVEGLNRWKEEAKAIINPIWEYADTLKVPLGESKTDAVIKHINEAKKLLNEVLVMNEAWGDLPGEFINKVKTFLYGE